jgi:hypothetical protein
VNYKFKDWGEREKEILPILQMSNTTNNSIGAKERKNEG